MFTIFSETKVWNDSTKLKSLIKELEQLRVNDIPKYDFVNNLLISKLQSREIFDPKDLQQAIENICNITEHTNTSDSLKQNLIVLSKELEFTILSRIFGFTLNEITNLIYHMHILVDNSVRFIELHGDYNFKLLTIFNDWIKKSITLPVQNQDIKSIICYIYPIRKLIYKNKHLLHIVGRLDKLCNHLINRFIDS